MRRDTRRTLTLFGAAICCTVLFGWLTSMTLLANGSDTPAADSAFSCANMTKVSPSIGESVPVIAVAECEALLQFYNALGGASWTIESNLWLVSDNPCKWRGVYCANQHVIRLELEERNLVGQIPGAALSALPMLRSLWLPSNALTGPIPSQLADLPNLMFLGLYDNQLTGPIPERLMGDANADFVEYGSSGYLNLDNNDLSGTLPLDLGRPKMNWVTARDNPDLVGQVPDTWQDMESLYSVVVTGTRICVPQDWTADTRVSGALPCSTIIAEGVGAGFEVCPAAVSSAGARQEKPCESPQQFAEGARGELGNGEFIEFPARSGSESGGARLLLECDEGSLRDLAELVTGIPFDSAGDEFTKIVLQYLMYIAAEGCPDNVTASEISAISGSTVDARLLMQLKQGALIADVKAPVMLEIETTTASVSAAQGIRFLVGYDPQSGQTDVEAYNGAVTVSPAHADFPAFTLAAGERVTVSADGPGEIVGSGTLYLPLLQR